MGRVARWLGIESPVIDLASAPSPAFSVGASEVDPALFGMESYTDTIAPVGRVARESAIQVPAVKRARDLVSGTLGTIPFVQVNGGNVRAASSLLEQPERNVPRSITMVRLFEDLLFEGIAWWLVTERDYRGYPTSVVRLACGSVTITRELRAKIIRPGVHGATWEYVEDKDLIRFESPNDGLLLAGGRAIRTLLKLEAAAGRYADEPLPSGYFKPTDGADPAEDEDVQTVLDDWGIARRTRSTAYVPAALTYETVQWSPEQLQMSEARQHAVLEIARLTGIDAEDLSVSTTSRTYQNDQDRRVARISDVLGPYASAVADRLSMGDVTPRGYTVQPDYAGFLRADDATRLGNYQTGLTIGLYTLEQIAEREGLPQPERPAQRSLRAVPNGQEDPVAASAQRAISFSAATVPVVGFDTEETRTAFEVDTEKRTIFGLAVPYGVPSQPKQGERFQFSQGSLALPSDPTRIKLLVSHDRSQAVGHAVELQDSPEGLWAKFSVARGPEGDRALSMADDHVWDGLSIGLRDGGKFSRKGAINHSVSNELAEISLTPDPAFSDARVSAVAAEADGKVNAMPCSTCGQNHAPGTPCATPAQPAAAPAVDLVAFEAAMAEKFGLTAVPAPAPAQGPAVISPVGSGAAFVSEAAPYRFDRGGNLVAGSHDFSTDLFAGIQGGDREAYDRALKFMQDRFDVDSADATAINPNGQRPDLYVDQRSYRYPLLEATRAGTLTDKTPFVIPKFNTATGMVAAHTEAVEPTPGTFTVTSATVTPGAVSGKVEITRELWDQGGNPNISGLIWKQMEKAYNEALEAKVVAVLDAATPTGITLTTAGGTDGQTASDELATAFAALQYVRGGFAFDTFAVQIDLYKTLATAKDTTKRPLFPIYNPMNANGQAAPRFGNMNVHGVGAFPEWALAATGTVAASSYLFDHESVRTWYSAPQRLEFQYRVAYVDLAIWGYSVAAILDTAGVREVIYDPA